MHRLGRGNLLATLKELRKSAGMQRKMASSMRVNMSMAEKIAVFNQEFDDFMAEYNKSKL